MWGSPSYISGEGSNTCLQCPNLEPCRAATMARQPVKCERSTDDSRRLPRLLGPYAVLTPDATFTVPELAELVGVSPGNAAKWTTLHTQAGDLTVVGTTYTLDHRGTRHLTRVYRLAEMP